VAQPDLPAPAVAADSYTEDYYRHSCGPHEEWNRHEGAVIADYYVGAVRFKIGIEPGDRLVDLGTGRGELLAAALDAGAASAVGVEYSTAGVELAAKTLEAQRITDRARVVQADVRDTGLASAQADVVTLLDVVEHLTPAEIDQALAEVHRLLVPGARIVIHTLPNRLVYDVTYRLQRLARPSRWRSWPRQPRQPLELEMHVNEQTRGDLRRSLGRAGFHDVEVAYGEWRLDHLQEPVERLSRRLGRYRLTRPLGAADLWACARRPAG